MSRAEQLVGTYSAADGWLPLGSWNDLSAPDSVHQALASELRQFVELRNTGQLPEEGFTLSKSKGLFLDKIVAIAFLPNSEQTDYQVICLPAEIAHRPDDWLLLYEASRLVGPQFGVESVPGAA